MRRIYPLDTGLAYRVAARRKALGWSQNRLALAAGLTESTVTKLETCRVPFSPAQHEAIEATLAAAESGAAAHWQAVAAGCVSR